VIHAILDSFPLELSRPIFEVCEQFSPDFARDQHGLCILKKCVTIGESKQLFRLTGRVRAVCSSMHEWR